MSNEINVVIGSWGSYNECNERALGSKWLTFNNFEDWSEIKKELKKQGFKLKGIDEELFIQDIEGINANRNWDYVNPEELFNTLKKSCVLDDEDKYEKMNLYLDIQGYDDFERLVEEYEDAWDDDIYTYPNFDWYDLGYYFLHEVNCFNIPEQLENYIDYARYGEELSYDGFYEYEGGIVEIRR